MGNRRKRQSSIVEDEQAVKRQTRRFKSKIRRIFALSISSILIQKIILLK